MPKGIRTKPGESFEFEDTGFFSFFCSLAVSSNSSLIALLTMAISYKLGI